MADVFTKEKRSWLMSRIRSKDTKIELTTAKALRKAGIRYRRHPKILGTPDFLVFSERCKALVFLDGDFWHGWNYLKRKPKLSLYWRNKIERNMKRDKAYSAKLKKQGWKVLRIWEHAVHKDTPKCIKRIRKTIS